MRMTVSVTILILQAITLCVICRELPKGKQIKPTTKSTTTLKSDSKSKIPMKSHTEELIMADALFLYGDSDRNRVITPAELFKFYSNIVKFSEKKSSVATKLMLKEGDASKDGSLTWSEIIKAMRLIHGPFKSKDKLIKITE